MQSVADVREQRQLCPLATPSGKQWRPHRSLFPEVSIVIYFNLLECRQLWVAAFKLEKSKKK